MEKTDNEQMGTEYRRTSRQVRKVTRKLQTRTDSMKKHHLFSNKQFGNAASNCTRHIWTEILEDRGGTDGVYCDFKKRFIKS